MNENLDPTNQNFNPEELFADTDIATSASWIKQYPLPDGEYVKQETHKEWIFLHHTAGRYNPYKCIDHWAKDQRGRVGTHYVIGGVPHNEDLSPIVELVFDENSESYTKSLKDCSSLSA